MSRDNRSKICQTSLPGPKSVKASASLSSEASAYLLDIRRQISRILQGEDSRMLLIVGPCSVHSVSEAKEYALKFLDLQNRVSDTFLPIMRTYFAKPRTSFGWKGLLFDPELNGSCDALAGIHITRQLLVDLAEQKIPLATEFLDPLSGFYFDDLIAWGCIGARTSESQTHREIASGLPMPVGFKNNTNGNLQVAVNGAYTASKSHSFFGIDEEGKISLIRSKGNPNSHIVLRGGESGTNYDPKSISESLKLLKNKNLPEKIIIDCSHGNSLDDHHNQTFVFESVINQVIEGNTKIAGVILESYLQSGQQKLIEESKTGPTYGISITDACLNWTTTEQLVLWGNNKLRRHSLPQKNPELTFHNAVITCKE